MNPIEELFAGDPSTDVPSVGIELELLPMRLGAGDRPAIVPISDTAPATGGVAYVSFEPGGQVELSPPPAPSAREAILAVTSLRRQLERRLQPHGVEMTAIGLEPWSQSFEVPLQLTTDRYVTLGAHYRRIGQHGEAFMRQTASTQICVGLRPGDDGRDQWYAANLIAPLLAATFANAPLRHGCSPGHNGIRTLVCRQADPGRHRIAWVGIEPRRAYAEFALAARPVGRAYAGPVALPSHLTTLFPPVRPRRSYLELRSIDSLAEGDMTAAVVLTAALLASPAAARATIERTTVTRAADRARWDCAAAHGIRDQRMAGEVLGLIEIATDALRTLPADYLPADAADVLGRLRDRVTAHRAPGDDSLTGLRPTLLAGRV